MPTWAIGSPRHRRLGERPIHSRLFAQWPLRIDIRTFLDDLEGRHDDQQICCRALARTRNVSAEQCQLSKNGQPYARKTAGIDGKARNEDDRAYHLDPEHRSILIFEAKTVEDVRDVLYESGFMHWCDGRIFPTTPLSEMHKWAVAQEPI